MARSATQKKVNVHAGLRPVRIKENVDNLTANLKNTAVNSYDPDHAPNSSEWLALDEQLRIQLVEEHHSRANVPLPNLKAHSIFHAIVENQLAENVAPATRAMARLIRGGLSRHDAVHAIASVVAEHVHDLYHDKADAKSSNAIYTAAIERLSARSWRGG
jgi:hypothetical protein